MLLVRVKLRMRNSRREKEVDKGDLRAWPFHFPLPAWLLAILTRAPQRVTKQKEEGFQTYHTKQFTNAILYILQHLLRTKRC